MTAMYLIDQKSFLAKINNFVSSIQVPDDKKQVGKFKTTSVLFELHSSVTPIILFFGVLLLSFNEYFGENINCLQSNSDIPKNLIEKYCWYEGSFVYYNAKQSISNQQIAYPGVSSTPLDKEEHHLHMKYYQWVHFVLIIQGVLFYLPKYIWNKSEGRKFDALCVEANKKPITDTNDKDRSKLIQEVYDSLATGTRSMRLFIQCEIFFLINLSIQIWFTNLFLNGRFLTLGYDWLIYNSHQLDHLQDPLIKLFPRLTKCQFHKYGFSGSIETHDALCFLSY